MPFLPLDLAIFERLVGAPLDSKGRPVLDDNGVPVNRALPGAPYRGRQPSYGVQIPTAINPQKTSRGLTSFDPAALRVFGAGWTPDNYRQVPVYDENIEDRKWEDVWPCVTFRMFDFEFAPQNGYVFHDPFCGFDPMYPEETITNRNGDVVAVGRGSRLIRAEPDPYDVTYMIRIYAKNKWEMMWIARQIIYLFPARTGIEVQTADGERRFVDMLLDRVENLDPGGNDLVASLGGEEQRYYSRAFFFKIETYFDNSVNSFGTRDIYSRNTITSRILEMANVRDTLLLQAQNLNELEPALVTA